MGVVIAAVGVLLLGLALLRRAPDAAAVAALLLIILGRTVPAEKVLSGFSDPTVATIVLMYVISAGVQRSGLADWLTQRLAGAGTAARARGLLSGLVAAMSTLASNTAVVATMLPVTRSIAARFNLPRSQLFMPLSFAAILGGLCTQIGTTTTLVVTAVLHRLHPETHFGMFSITPVGLPVALIGLAYVILAAPRLLPSRPEFPEALSSHGVGDLTIPVDSPVAGLTIAEANLRHLPGVFLSRIHRGHSAMLAVGADEVLLAGDTLTFVGDLSALPALASQHGLSMNETVTPGAAADLTEVSVRGDGGLVGLTVREARFRNRFGAVVVAVYRGGQHLEGKLGDVTLRSGDTLLLESGRDFAERTRDQRDLYVLRADPANRQRATSAALIVLGMVAVVAAGLLPLLSATMLAAAAMLLTKCCSLTEARKAIDWQVIVVLGASLGIGAALEHTGATQLLAESISAVGLVSSWAVLATIYITTVTMTSFVSNGATAAIMTPVALHLATLAGLNPVAVAICVAVAASADFVTPIGYQTNLMVQGPGGYAWSDYFRFGLPLLVLVGATTVSILGLMFA